MNPVKWTLVHLFHLWLEQLPHVAPPLLSAEKFEDTVVALWLSSAGPI